MKVGEAFSPGKVFRAYSEDFGTHVLLCIRCPGSTSEERRRALTIDNFPVLGEALNYSSFANDTVEREWANLLEYIKEMS